MSINMSNLLNTQLSARHAEMMAKHRENIAERIAAANVRREQAQAARQEKSAPRQENIAALAEGNTATKKPNQSGGYVVQAGSVKSVGSFGSETMNRLLQEARDRAMSGEAQALRKQKVEDHMERLENKPNRLMTEFRPGEWKKDREEAGLFDRYAEAGEKVQVPTVLRTTGGNPYSSQQLTEDEVRERYGNYFVYKMERHTSKIMNLQESIEKNEESLMNHQLAYDQTADKEVKATRLSLMEWHEKHIKNQEGELYEALDKLSGWMERNDVTNDAKQFFQEFSRDYYKDEQNLDHLFGMYGILSDAHDVENNTTHAVIH